MLVAEQERRELYGRIRDEIYHAKTLVRSVRNATQVKAAALQDSEERLDALLEELDDHHRIPTPEGGPGTNGKAEDHTYPAQR